MNSLASHGAVGDAIVAAGRLLDEGLRRRSVKRGASALAGAGGVDGAVERGVDRRGPSRVEFDAAGEGGVGGVETRGGAAELAAVSTACQRAATASSGSLIANTRSGFSAFMIARLLAR